MIELGVNIDHVATLRQARRTHEPDPVWAAVEAHLGRAGATEGMSSREFQSHLDVVMAEWMVAGDVRWQAFVDGAMAALADVAAGLPSGCDAVVTTSAGVTAAITGRLLGADPEGVVALNRVSVNASITTVVSGVASLPRLRRRRFSVAQVWS